MRKNVTGVSVPHKEKVSIPRIPVHKYNGANAGIPKIFIDHAMIIHKDISSKKLFRGDNRDGKSRVDIHFV
jgi:hypothetical protein